MYKILGFWSYPAAEDIDEFERQYLDVHCPKACRLPGLRECVLTRLASGPDGVPGSAPYYRLAELIFNSEDDLLAALTSPEAHVMSQDAEDMKKRFGMTVTTIGMGPEQTLWPIA